jgi:riboflavin biosynthesis pyrimidine reductase
MPNANIDRGWPPPPAALLDDEHLSACYALDERSRQSVRLNFVASIDGAGTVRAEGYGAMRLDRASVQWRRDNGLADQPVFAIVSGALHLDPGSAIFTEAPLKAVVVTVGASASAKKASLSRVADVLVCGEDRLDVRAMLNEFAKRGLRQVLCEGGPTLFGTLLEAIAWTSCASPSVRCSRQARRLASQPVRSPKRGR